MDDDAVKSGILDPVVEVLLRNGEIQVTQVHRAFEIQGESGGELGWIMATEGMISRIVYYAALAEARGLPLARDIERLRTHIDIELLVKMTYEQIVRYHFAPFAMDGSLLVIITSNPRSAESHEFIREHFGVEEISEILVTDLDLFAIAARNFRDEIIDEAVMSNYYRNPEQSAKRVFTQKQLLFLGAIAGGLVVWAYLNVLSLLIFVIAALQFFFLANVIFKVVLSVVGARNEIEQPISDDDIAALEERSLPSYSVLVPVYREPEVVHHLIEGIKNIDYPQHKLDVMLLLEEDDRATLEAAKKASPSANWRLIVVPNRQPRTKPKACNYGLFFARGKYLVIYDAEDVPQPTQLKAAVVAFRNAGEEYICFQAALNYFNATENFLTRMFTLEYSYWFDYLIPGLERLGLPIPLGGTSNHFDVEKLRKLGGWDPFNTTEDADLGIRAAVEKYKVGFINSTTFEEANAELTNWIRQRSRWIKGYMQTWLVFSRDPAAMIRAIGWKNYLAFQIFVGGTPLSFLAALPLWGVFVAWIITRTHVIEPLFPDTVLYVALANLLFGNFLGIYLNMVAVFLRRNYWLMPYSLLNPVYWILGSIASYKALWQLFTKPFFWEKTLHGISRFTPSGSKVA